MRKKNWQYPTGYLVAGVSRH